MKFLIDNALSPLVSTALVEAGYDAIHVRDRGMAAATDSDILQLATSEDRIIVSADTDFGTLLTLRSASKPSFILFRQTDKTPANQISLLLQYLPEFKSDLLNGCIIVFGDTRIRIRQLPVGGE